MRLTVNFSNRRRQANFALSSLIDPDTYTHARTLLPNLVEQSNTVGDYLQYQADYANPVQQFLNRERYMLEQPMRMANGMGNIARDATDAITAPFRGDGILGPDNRQLVRDIPSNLNKLGQNLDLGIRGMTSHLPEPVQNTGRAIVNAGYRATQAQNRFNQDMMDTAKGVGTGIMDRMQGLGDRAKDYLDARSSTGQTASGMAGPRVDPTTIGTSLPSYVPPTEPVSMSNPPSHLLRDSASLAGGGAGLGFTASGGTGTLVNKARKYMHRPIQQSQ